MSRRLPRWIVGVLVLCAGLLAQVLVPSVVVAQPPVTAPVPPVTVDPLAVPGIESPVATSTVDDPGSSDFEDLPPLPGEQPRPKKSPDPDKMRPVRELLDQRGPNFEVWENVDGSRTLQMFGEDRYFKPAGAKGFVAIDSRVVADVDRVGVLVNAANSWRVRFTPIDGRGGGGVELTTAEGEVVRFSPIGAKDSVPVVGSGATANVVTFTEVWPGIDVVYTVTAARLKEDIVIKRRGGRGSFVFAVDGASVSNDSAFPGRLKLGLSNAVVELPEVVDRTHKLVRRSETKPTFGHAWECSGADTANRGRFGSIVVSFVERR